MGEQATVNWTCGCGSCACITTVGCAGAVCSNCLSGSHHNMVNR